MELKPYEVCIGSPHEKQGWDIGKVLRVFEAKLCLAVKVDAQDLSGIGYSVTSEKH